MEVLRRAEASQVAGERTPELHVAGPRRAGRRRRSRVLRRGRLAVHGRARLCAGRRIGPGTLVQRPQRRAPRQSSLPYVRCLLGYLTARFSGPRRLHARHSVLQGPAAVCRRCIGQDHPGRRGMEGLRRRGRLAHRSRRQASYGRRLRLRPRQYVAAVPECRGQGAQALHLPAGFGRQAPLRGNEGRDRRTRPE